MILERDIQKQCVDYLRIALPSTAIVFAVPNGGYRKPVEAAIMKGMGTVPGVADLILIHNGQAHGIELKAAKGKATDAQVTWAETFRNAGGRYAVVRNLEQLEEVLTDWGVPLKARRAA